MDFLTQSIKFSVIFCASLLIPFSNVIHNKNGDLIDFDGNNQLISDSDFLLEDVAISQSAIAIDNDTELAILELRDFTFSPKADSEKLTSTINTPDFWTTLHSIESKQGRLLYRPSNKNRNCASTASPCGHHQLSLQALKDISCTTKKCKADREDFDKSLAMSKRLEAINLTRLKKAGLTNLPEYQQYLIHQQGATGLKIILAASKGKRKLSKSLERNMANNSPYSYKKLRKLGSKLAAQKFLKHWQKKWQNEKKLIIAYQSNKNQSIKLASSSYSKKNRNIKKKVKAANIPFFNDYQLQIALNLKAF